MAEAESDAGTYRSGDCVEHQQFDFAAAGIFGDPVISLRLLGDPDVSGLFEKGEGDLVLADGGSERRRAEKIRRLASFMEVIDRERLTKRMLCHRVQPLRPDIKIAILHRDEGPK